MEFFWIVAAIMVFLIGKGFYDKKKAKERLIERIQKEWGKLPDQEYTDAKFSSIQYYYKNKFTKKKNLGFLLDEITWNDLNLDELYFMLNHTGSAMGEEMLWALLHEMQLSENVLAKREKILTIFQTNAEVRKKLQTGFALIGKNNKVSVYEYMDQLDRVSQESNLHHYFGISGIIVSVLLLCFSVDYAGLFLIGFIIFNLLTYYKRKGEIEIYYSVISYLIRMLDNAEKMTKNDIPELEEYLSELKVYIGELKAFRKGAPAVTPQNPTGDMMAFFMDYVRILFHTDLIKFNKMIRQYFNKKEKIIQVFEIVGYLDALCAVASFRTWLKEYCLPVFTKDKQLKAEALYHPFLKKPVPADIDTRNSVLITGSNASGKSTFIKSVAINAIMAQTIHTVCATSYQAAYFKVYTSMALTDNLFGGESYYIVEIKSLKRILDAARDDIPVLCFVDEVLRGTNTVERIAASSRILHSIAAANALMFAATHDIELTYMLEESFENYHFEEQVLDGKILFDYQLKKGRATTQNAIALLEMLGYPKEIIAKAKATAQYFIEQGEWQSVTK